MRLHSRTIWSRSNAPESLLSTLTLPVRTGRLFQIHPIKSFNMTEGLKEKACTPCRGGVPPLETEEAGKLLQQVPSWELVDDATRLRRQFKFDNFRSTLEFVKQVGELAEEQGHHPTITFGWGFCQVDLQTKKIKGLHENDFIMAARIDVLAEN